MHLQSVEATLRTRGVSILSGSQRTAGALAQCRRFPEFETRRSREGASTLTSSALGVHDDAISTPSEPTFGNLARHSELGAARAEAELVNECETRALMN